jgi:hypothetical protein
MKMEYVFFDELGWGSSGPRIPREILHKEKEKL